MLRNLKFWNLESKVPVLGKAYTNKQFVNDFQIAGQWKTIRNIHKIHKNKRKVKKKMNLLKIARKKAIPRNKANKPCGNQKEYSVYHVTTSHLDTRELIESTIPGKNTFKGMDEMEILQDVCGN